MEKVNQSIIKISPITENSIAARDKRKSKHVEFEAKTDDDVLLDRPNLVGQLQMDHLERGTLAWSPQSYQKLQTNKGCQNKLLPILMMPKEGSIQANYSYSPTFEETPS